MKQFLPLLACLFLGACGGDSGDGDGDGDADSGTSVTTFVCGERGGECELADEYCLLSITNGTESANECVERPANCNDCDCATDDAPEHSVNCEGGGLITCNASGNNDGVAITVRCSKSL